MIPSPPRSDHPRDLLPAYLAGTLDPAATEQIRRHLAACATCRAEVRAWSAIREAALVATAPNRPPAPDLLDGVRARIDAAETARAGQRPGFLRQLVLAQIPLVRQQLWAASALIMGLGGLVAFWAGPGAGAVLAIVAPLVAAAGVAVIYGPDNDPPLELALATPTSPRLVLLARLTLVCGYDCLLTLLASGLLAGFGATPDGLLRLVLRWLGPMLLLSAISLGLSLHFGSLAGSTVALTLWIARGSLAHGLIGPDLAPALRRTLTLLGTTNAATVGLALAIGVAALWWLPRQEQPAWA